MGADNNAGLVSIGRYKGEAHHKAALTRLTGEWGFWSLPETLATLSSPHCHLLYAATPQRWLGVLLAQWSPPLVDVIYIYVAPEARGLGLGMALLQGLWEDMLAASEALQGLMLEVRPSNEAARSLYEKFGMSEIARRKVYYDDGEDALIYRRLLQP